MDILLSGACGRMGSEVIRAVAQSAGARIVAALERPGHPMAGRDAGEAAGIPPIGVEVTTDARAALAPGVVAIDFSDPEGTTALLAALEEAPRPAVVGVTGLSAAARERWAALSRRTAVMIAPNLSVGAAVLGRLAAIAAGALPGFDVELVEAHHRGKADAPSGTALAIVEAVAAARGTDPAAAAVHGRRPGEGPRRTGTIGVHAVRGGSVTGDHSVLLLGDGERIEIRHVAESRAIFARGAIAAAIWIAGRGPGLYAMDDVVSTPSGGSPRLP